MDRDDLGTIRVVENLDDRARQEAREKVHLPDTAGPDRIPQDIALTKISDNVYSSPAEPLEDVQ